MPRKSNVSPAASRTMEEQAARLRRLRQLTGLEQDSAADIAQVSRDSWGRMERGETAIATVALHNFLAAYQYSPAYVISGRFDGLPPDLVRDLIRDENETEAKAAAEVARGTSARRERANSDK